MNTCKSHILDALLNFTLFLADETDSVDGPRAKLTPQSVRALWRKAILETLLLIRMERENKTLQGKLRLLAATSLVIYSLRSYHLDAHQS
jgi:hypothetical protein